MSDVENFVHEEDPDVLMLTESWTTNLIPNAEISLQDYDMFRKDNESSRGDWCVVHSLPLLRLKQQ